MFIKKENYENSLAYQESNEPIKKTANISMSKILLTIYLAGILFFFLRLITLIFWLRQIIKRNKVNIHPNYKIAEIMFNYNLAGFQEKDENIFNASVVNTNYARLFAHYSNDAWSWRFDLIMATANEVAKSGASFYDHDKAAYVTTAGADQDSNLGMEFDAAFDYEWSPSIVVTGYVAHYQVGDYYAFTNSSTPLSLGDVTATGFKLNIGF